MSNEPKTTDEYADGYADGYANGCAEMYARAAQPCLRHGVSTVQAELEKRRLLADTIRDPYTPEEHTRALDRLWADAHAAPLVRYRDDPPRAPMPWRLRLKIYLLFAALLIAGYALLSWAAMGGGA